MLPSPDPASFCPKSCFSVSYCPSPSIANLNLLASMAAKVNTGSQFFSDAPIARTPAKFGPCFLVNYSPSPINLYTKFEVASFNGCRNKHGVPKFFGCPLAQTPANFDRKSCFSASYSPSPSCISHLELLASSVAEITRGFQVFYMLP